MELSPRQLSPQMSIIESSLLHLKAAAHAKLWLQGRETGHVEVPSD